MKQVEANIWQTCKSSGHFELRKSHMVCQKYYKNKSYSKHNLYTTIRKSYKWKKNRTNSHTTRLATIDGNVNDIGLMF